MTKQELNQAINNCITNNSGVEIYFGLKNGEIRKANFLAETQNEIKELFAQELQSKVVTAEISILNLSAADERSNAIFLYDLERTEEMEVFNQVLNADTELSLFSFEEDTISNISYFLLVIGTNDNQIVLYKQLSAVNIYKQNSGLFVRRSNNEFQKINDDFLRIVPGVDIFQINGELYVLNLQYLEKKFNIHDVIVNAARTQIDNIRSYELVENIDDLETELSDVSFARKLSKIAENSPVLGQVDNQRIIEFTHNHPALRNVIKYSADGNKIKLTSKLSKKLFLKLLNDDYLTSNLTSKYYDSIAKDNIPNEPVLN